MRSEFLCGVIEGFYGQPWTLPQRLQAVRQLAEWGLNTYFYAPKDDLKHRALWRQCYDQSELESLDRLIQAAAAENIHFIYGLSPGLDIRFSDAAELDAIQQRLDQLMRLGVRRFALLFDDLPGQMNAQDRSAFASVAEAQSHVANRTLARCKQQSADCHLLFCPTPYCDRMDRWQLGGAGYLDTLGQQLDGEIDVFWTGPEIVSEEISVGSIEAVSKRLGRAPVIWDNLHANDYDMRRLYCGPYSGRPEALREHVRGILSNPNNEFPINYIPLRTLGMYVHCDGDWDPREAFLEAFEQWILNFETVTVPIRREDLSLLADCFYLPYCEGPQADEMYRLISSLLRRPVVDWGVDEKLFRDFRGRVERVFEGLTQLKNRELFYAWSRRAWDLKEEVELFGELFQRIRTGENLRQGIQLETFLPKTYRGGLIAKLQRLLSFDDHGRLTLSG